MKRIWKAFEILCGILTAILCVPVLLLAVLLWGISHYIEKAYELASSQFGLREQVGSSDQERIL